MKEISIFSIYLPPVLGYLVLCIALWYPVTRLLAKAGLSRFVWHAPLFNTALFAIVFFSIMLLV